MRAESDPDHFQLVTPNRHALNPEATIVSASSSHRRCFGVEHDERLSHGPAGLIPDGSGHDTGGRLGGERSSDKRQDREYSR